MHLLWDFFSNEIFLMASFLIHSRFHLSLPPRPHEILIISFFPKKNSHVGDLSFYYYCWWFIGLFLLKENEGNLNLIRLLHLVKNQLAKMSLIFANWAKKLNSTNCWWKYLARIFILYVNIVILKFLRVLWTSRDRCGEYILSCCQAFLNVNQDILNWK